MLVGGATYYRGCSFTNMVAERIIPPSLPPSPGLLLLPPQGDVASVLCCPNSGLHPPADEPLLLRTSSALLCQLRPPVASLRVCPLHAAGGVWGEPRVCACVCVRVLTFCAILSVSLHAERYLHIHVHVCVCVKGSVEYSSRVSSLRNEV